MARPVGADAEVTRNRVLSSAAALFAAHGEGNTSMRQIAGQAGVSLGTVHHYFGSKARLYETCIEAMYLELGELRDQLLTALGESVEPVEAIEVVVRSAFRFARRRREAIRLIMRDVVHAGQVNPALRARFVAPALEDGVRLMSPLMQCDVLEVRLTLQTLVNMVVRYAMTTDDELAAMTTLSVEEAPHAVEEHLVGVARDVLKLDPKV